MHMSDAMTHSSLEVRAAHRFDTSMTPTEVQQSIRHLGAELYADLKRVAASYLRERSDSRSLDPTMLVHESFLRLFDKARTAPADRDHFMALSARIMRQILVDHARRRCVRSRARNTGRMRSLTQSNPLSKSRTWLLELEEALDGLARRDARQAKIVELRIFGGFDTNTIAHLLGVSRRTVELDWRMAKAWLKIALGDVAR